MGVERGLRELHSPSSFAKKGRFYLKAHTKLAFGTCLKALAPAL